MKTLASLLPLCLIHVFFTVSQAAEPKQDADLAAAIRAACDLRDRRPGAPKDAREFLPALESENLSLKAAVLEAMARVGIPSEGIDRVKRILLSAHEDLYLRKLAAEALGARSNRKGEVIDFLVRELGNGNCDVAYYCACALSDRIRPESPEFRKTVSLLSAASAGKDTRRARFALFALARIGPAAGRLKFPDKDPGSDLKHNIVERLRDPDPHVRVNALEALSRVWPQSALSLIVPLLEDESFLVARAAASAVSTLEKDPAALNRTLERFRRRAAWKPSSETTEFSGYGRKLLEKCEVGGPLAGLRLPLFPTYHGEPPGHPGKSAGAPELKLHEASVEHWRAYWFKYCNVRSFYDKQSLLRNWSAPDIPASGTTRKETYAEPVYHVPRHALPVKTGKLMPPVPVIRCKVEDPVFELDLGELPVGLYAVRVIAAVPEKEPRVFLEPLFFRMEVNDRPDGGTSRYRIRCAYVDQFYGIAELYFHAWTRRRYKVRLWVAEGSRVEPLVHNIELHDALAGAVKAALKRHPTTVSLSSRVDYRTRYLTEERLARDSEIWRGFPPLNKQFGHYAAMLSATHFQSPRDVVRFGLDGIPMAEIRRRFGKWVWARNQYPLFMVNRKSGLVYTYEDLAAGRPLPDPYPFKDDGAGLYQADPERPDKGMAWIPVAEGVSENIRFYGIIDRRKNCDEWVRKGDIDAARDEAVRLIRIALQVPTYETSHALNNVVSNPGPYGRDMALRRRQTQPQGTWLSHYPNYREPVLHYDKLFTYIDGNRELAQSVGRFVPWVKKPRDLIKLLDTYLVQTVAKRTLRYQYYTSNSALAIADIALVMEDKRITAPWVEWLFSRTFIYPLPVEGIQNLGITSSDRSGCTYIGSSFYAGGEGAAQRARNVEKYIRQGLFPRKYDFRRPDLYPKTAAHLDWHLDIIVAGHDFLRIGDVTGAERNALTTFRGVEEYAPYGWKWFKSPRWAWVIRYVIGRKDETDEEWREIEKAASRVRRAPWLDNVSRQVYNWAGVLENGLEHDDYRFRSAVYVRTGLGHGHAHADSLDLQIVSLGLPMTVDGGQRPGYSTPYDGASCVHNTVLVDDAGNYFQSWIRTINDARGAKYMEAEGEHAVASLFRRQVALVEIDPGKGSRPLGVEQQKFGARLPTEGIVPASSYVVDVFRIEGGKRHTYAFHGPVSDEVTVNARNVKDVAIPKDSDALNAEQSLLRRFGKSPFRTAGDAGNSTTAIWRYTRTGVGAESLHGNFDPRSPRKFLKLTLFDTSGMRVLRAQGVTHARNYKLDHVFVQKRSEDGKPLSTVFAAVIEPFAGRSEVVSKRLVEIENQRGGARRAVGVEVKIRNGRRDIVFMDAETGKLRRLGDLRVSGEYAFYSTDSQGLRSAVLHGGESFEAPDVKIRVRERVYRSRIVSVDYLKKRVVIDPPWPAAPDGRIVEITAPGRRTSYTLESIQVDIVQVDSAKVEGPTDTLTFARGAKFYRSTIEEITDRIVRCRLTLPLGRRKGLERGFTAVNDKGTKFWHADYLGGASWRLNGEPVASDDFAVSRALTLYEYGPGDEVELKTQVSVVRKSPGVYVVAADTPSTIELRGKKAVVISSLKSRQSVSGDRITVQIGP